jgi:hypothetical protein
VRVVIHHFAGDDTSDQSPKQASTRARVTLASAVRKVDEHSTERDDMVEYSTFSQRLKVQIPAKYNSQSENIFAYNV